MREKMTALFHDNSSSLRFPLWILVALVVTTIFVVAVDSEGAQENDPASNSKTAQTSKKTDSANKKSKPATANKKKSASQSKKKKSGKPIENPFPNRIKAQSLDGGTEWLNTSGEITLKDLRGKIVLLDFWTYCCINCMHVLPDLAYLEKKYPNEVVVIGVHSAKFDNEKDSENIRRAIVRYEIEHPVINDSEMLVWRKFGVRSWPTLVMLDPEGFYCGYVSGEGNRELLVTVLDRLIKYHDSKGTLDRTPVRFDLEREKLPPTPLKFPGKVLADEKNNRLFTTDSNHNRIVISTLDGQLTDVIGTGAIGNSDGGYDAATFDHPQGTCLVGETLYVADTENHQIRVVDLKTKQVSTLAGTGKQANFRASGGALKATALNSPWAIEHIDGILYIAMAGPHQIWSHKIGSQRIGVYAGSGREDITNGSLSASAFAQPSGIVSNENGSFFYVADSEGSSIRKVPAARKGRVSTIVGSHDLPNARCLFEFGDIDDIGSVARLQHPLGLALQDGILYVADTYNHKIKKIDLKTNEIKTWLGDGTRGNQLDPPRFSEPSGLTIAQGKLYITDTNNHRLCVADLKTGKVSVLEIIGLTPPKSTKPQPQDLAAGVDAINVKPQTVAAGDSLNFEITLNLPMGYKLNKLAPVTYKLTAEGSQDLIADGNLNVRGKAQADGSTVTVTVPLAKKSGKATLDLALRFGYCREGKGGLCKLKTARWKIPVEVAADAAQKAVQLEASAGK